MPSLNIFNSLVLHPQNSSVSSADLGLRFDTISRQEILCDGKRPCRVLRGMELAKNEEKSTTNLHSEG